MTDSLSCGICHGGGGYGEGSPEDRYLSALEAFYAAYTATEFQCSEYECYTDWSSLDAARARVEAARKDMPAG